ncbi:MAG: helix-turn-helix transcriptional regulator [Collinsella sp.]|uniref:helix-turn-helix transcriptional regulator n=1 Tax=Collinsella sp. TaxID=1965294 RepID=UPI003990A4C4
MELQLMRLRKQAGFKSRDDFANALGVNPLTYKGWETGRTRLKLEDACDIADLLRCTLDELAGRDFRPETYADRRQAALNSCYSKLNERSKTELAGLASTMTADASRLSVKSREDTEPVVSEEIAEAV